MIYILLYKTATWQRTLYFRKVKLWNSLDPVLKLKPTFMLKFLEATIIPKSTLLPLPGLHVLQNLLGPFLPVRTSGRSVGRTMTSWSNFLASIGPVHFLSVAVEALLSVFFSISLFFLSFLLNRKDESHGKCVCGLWCGVLHRHLCGEVNKHQLCLRHY